jgi:transcriptional regulator GlxA family with amidase domain
MTKPSIDTIAVLAFDGISPFHLSVPSMVFGEERAVDGGPCFEVRVCAAERGPLRTPAGFTVEVTHGLEALDDADIVIVPSWRESGPPAPPALLQALRDAHQRGAVLVGLCLGAFLLAEAGLLDGRPATTHWLAVPSFAERFAQVKLQPDVLYVDDGDVLTSAGTVAGIDCCLHLLRVRHGAEAANRAGRRMVVAPHRQGGQAQYIEQPVRAPAERDRMGQLLEWLGANLNEPHTLDGLADRTLMSRRTFTRHFRQATGTTVGQWLQGQRLALAQRLLEGTGKTIEAVAAEAGFGSAVSLRQGFRGAFGVSPTAYRRQFSVL